MGVKESVVHYTPQLRDLWPSPLAAEWARHYPQLFDEDDMRITRLQPKSHFYEWLAAIYLFHRDGALSLVEKYVFRSHPRKRLVVEGLLTGKLRAALADIRAEFHVQPPDLLVFTPERSRFWFAEVKGPGDRIRAVQRRSHEAIERRLGVPVELVRLVPINALERTRASARHSA